MSALCTPMRREDNFMMCGICPSNPVFYTSRQYTEHVLRCHPRASTTEITNREINMYSLHGRQPETVAGTYNNICSISPSILREGFLRTEEILASAQRQQYMNGTTFQTNNNNTNSSSDHNRFVPDSRIDGLVADMQAQKMEFEKMKEESIAKSAKIRSLEDQLIELQQKFRQVDEALASKMEDSREQQRLDEKAEIRRLEDLLEEKAKEIAEINREKSTSEHEFITFILRMKEDYQTLKKKFETIQYLESDEEREKELVNLRRTRDAQSSELAGLRAQLNEDAESSSTEINNLKNEVRSKNKLISELEQDRLVHNDRMDEMTDMISSNYNTYKSECDDLKQELKVSSMMNIKLNETVVKLEKQLEETTNSFEVSLNNQDGKICELTSKLNEEKQNLNKLTTELRNRSLKNDKLEALNGELKSDIALNSQKLEVKTKQIADLQSLLESRTKDEQLIEELRLQIIGLKESLSEKDLLLQTMVKEKEKTTNSFEVSLNIQEGKICELTNKLDQEKQNLNKLTTELRNMSLKNDKLEALNGELKRDTALNAQEVKIKTKQIADLQSLLESRTKGEQLIEELRLKIIGLNESLSEKDRFLQTMVKERDETTNSFQVSLKKEERKICELTSKLNEEKQNLRKLTTELRNMSLKNDKLEAVNGELRSDISLNAEELEIKNKQIADLQSLLESRTKGEADLKLRFESDLSVKVIEINNLNRIIQEQKKTTRIDELKPGTDNICTTKDTLNPTDESGTCLGDKFQSNPVENSSCQLISVEIPTGEVLSSNEDKSAEDSIQDSEKSLEEEKASLEEEDVIDRMSDCNIEEDDINDNMSECDIEEEVVSYSDESDTESEADSVEEDVVDSEDDECFIPRSTSYWNIHDKENSGKDDFSAVEQNEDDNDNEYDSEFHSDSDSDGESDGEEGDQGELDFHHDDMGEIDSENESAPASECSEMEDIDEELDESVAESCNDSEDCAPGSDTAEDVNENKEIGEVPAVETVTEQDSPSDQSEVESVSRDDSENSASEAAVDGEVNLEGPSVLVSETKMIEAVGQAESDVDPASECSDAKTSGNEESSKHVSEDRTSDSPHDAKAGINDSDSESLVSDDDGIMPTNSSLNIHQTENDDLPQNSDGSDCGDFEPDDEKFFELTRIPPNLQKDDLAHDSDEPDCFDFEPNNDKFNEFTSSLDFDNRSSQQNSDSDSSDYDYDYGGYNPSTIEKLSAPSSIIVVSDSDPNIPKPKSILRLVSKYEMNPNGESSQESINLPKKKIFFKTIEAEFRYIDPRIIRSDTSRDTFLYESMIANSIPCGSDDDILDDDFDLTFADQALDPNDSLDMIPDEEEEIKPLTAKDIFGDLPPLDETSPPSQKGSSASSLGDLPPLSPKSSSSLLGDLPTLSPSSPKNTYERRTDGTFANSNDIFSFSADRGDESYEAEDVVEEEIEEEVMSDFGDEDIALILENL